jgi:hypothetical protein
VYIGVVTDGEARPGPYADIARQTAQYLTEHAQTTTGQEAKFEYTAVSEQADIVLNFTPIVSSCGSDLSTSTFIYCTSTTLNPESRAPDQTEVRLSTSITDKSLTLASKVGSLTLLGVDPYTTSPELNYTRDTRFPYIDPWPGSNDLTVRIENPAGSPKNTTALVQSAIDYWEANESRYAQYQADWSVEPDAQDPDVTVRFVRDIDSCGLYISDDTIGCASQLNDSLANPPEVVEIQTGYTADSMVDTIKHEFGHLYGLNHSSEPQPLMAAEGVANLVPVPNATERNNTFGKGHFTVYIDGSDSGLATESIRKRAKTALDYYASGADGYLEDGLSYEFTDNRTQADIVLTVARSGEFCNLDAGSCSSYFGENLDSDPAFERYTRLNIYVYDIPVSTLSWHIGAQLSALSPEGSPPPFDGEDDDRRNWDS